MAPEKIEECLARIEQEIDATATLAQDMQEKDRVRPAQPAPERHGVSRILIVDDEPSVLEVLASLLSDEGHAVQCAPDGRVALEVLASNLPDLLITDVMMPRLDGWTLLTSVRERTPVLPVIVMSAVDRRVARRNVFSADHTVFLRKPFDIETLLTTIERLITSQPRGLDGAGHEPDAPPRRAAPGRC